MNLFARASGTVAVISATLQRFSLRGQQIEAGSVGFGFQSFTIPTVTAVTPDMSAGSYVVVTMTNGAAITLAAPVNPVSGQTLTVEFRNTSGGAAGALTFNAIYKTIGAWVQPATGNNRKIQFVYNGTNWTELDRQTSDVAN